MMITNEEARERVAIGAAYLDQTRPGWHDRIDIGTLTLHDLCGCIVGQLCPASREFREGLRTLGIVSTGVDHGMDLTLKEIEGASNRRVGFIPLQDAWIEAIAARRHPVSEEETTSPRASQLTYAVARAANQGTADTSRMT